MKRNLVFGLIYRASKDDHHRQQGSVECSEGVEDGVLIIPEGLPHEPFGAVAVDGTFYVSSGSKSNLKGNVQGGFLLGDDPVDNADRSGSDRSYIRPGPIKQRANQPLELEPKCRRKPIGRLMGGSRFHEEEKRRAEAGSALLRTAGVTYRQVLASFRAAASQ